MRPLKRWFLPEAPDLVALLAHQGEVTVGGMEAFAAWAHGDGSREADVRAAEHEADRARHAVLAVVRRAFISPIAPEDAFELSERLDMIMNGAKDLVREAEVLGMAPDAAMAEMADVLVGCVRDLVGAVADLARDPDAATDAADAAVHRQRGVERAYRRAMSALPEDADIREVVGRRELYRRCARLGDSVEHVAHRIWYAVVKGD